MTDKDKLIEEQIARSEVYRQQDVQSQKKAISNQEESLEYVRRMEEQQRQMREECALIEDMRHKEIVTLLASINEQLKLLVQK